MKWILLSSVVARAEFELEKVKNELYEINIEYYQHCIKNEDLKMINSNLI